MPDKLTDSEIKKALECCKSSRDFKGCKKCPMVDLPDCYEGGSIVLSTAIVKHIENLINRLKAENERLSKENIALNRRAIPSSGHILKVGNALLFAENEKDYDITINTIKTETYKEFADLSIKRICEEVSAPTPSESYIVEKCNQTIYNLLKEKVGDDNAE